MRSDEASEKEKQRKEMEKVKKELNTKYDKLKKENTSDIEAL